MTASAFRDGDSAETGPQRTTVSSYYIQNTFKAIQGTFRSLKDKSKRRCKISVYLVILGELESFRNCKGLSTIFPKILDDIWRRY